MEFTNEELQEYLNKHAKRAVKEMKQKAYGRQHRKLFYDIDEIEFNFIKTNNCLGKYVHGNDVNTTISISDEFISNKKSLFRYDKKMIGVIKHELIHHYVKTEYTLGKNDNRFYSDSSPIFLSYLTWFGVDSGHRCFEYFEKTELCKSVKKIESFNELEDEMISLWSEYRKVFRKLSSDNFCGESFSNTFTFGTGYTIGLNKEEMILFDDYSKFSSVISNRMNFFNLGCNVLPNELERVYSRKRYSNRYTRVKGFYDDSTNLDGIKKILDEHNKTESAKIIEYKVNKRKDKRVLKRLAFSETIKSYHDLLLLHNEGLLLGIEIDENYKSEDTYRVITKRKDYYRKYIYNEITLVKKSNINLDKLKDRMPITTAPKEDILDQIIGNLFQVETFELCDLELLKESNYFTNIVKNEDYDEEGYEEYIFTLNNDYKNEKIVAYAEVNK